MLTETLESHEEDITDAIKEQLRYGKKGDGTLFEKYSPLTIQKKQENGRVIMGERIALIDTGDFWQSIFATPYDNMIEIDAKDWKRDELVERYGEVIFQLLPEQWKHIFSLVEEEYRKKVYAWLNQ